VETIMLGKAALGLFVLVLASGAAAQDEPPNGNDPDRIVCKTIGESGSRLRRARICYSLAEWAERQRRTQELIDRMQTNHSTNG
jgi:hypothetical protein